MRSAAVSSATMSPAAQVGMPTALHDGNRDNDRNEPATDGGSREILRRSAAGARLGRRHRRAVQLHPAHEPAQRRRRDPQAQGVLCRGTGRSGRGPSRLRSLRGEAGPAGPTPRGADAGAWGGGSEGRRRRRPLRRRCVAHCGGRSGQPLLEPLPTGSGDQCARLRAGGRRRGGPPGEAGNLPLGGERGRLPPQAGGAARLRPQGRRGSWRISVPGAVAPGRPRRAEGLGVAACVLCPGRSRAGGGGGRCGGAGGGAAGARRCARGALRGREGRALLPLDPGADLVLRRLLRLGAVGACRRRV